MSQKKALFETVRLAIGLPVGGEVVNWRFMMSLIEMEKPPQHGVILKSECLIDRNRNEIVKLMLNHPIKFTHLCFLDSDMIFAVNTFKSLIEHDKEIVGGLCYQRKPPYAPLIFKRTSANLFDRVTDIKPDDKGLMKIDACGTGCLLIKREVFEKIDPPWFMVSWEGNQIIGEDISFAERCFQKGIPTYVDTQIKIGHLTTAAVTKADEGWAFQAKLLP